MKSQKVIEPKYKVRVVCLLWWGLGAQLLSTVIKTDLRRAMELRRASAPNVQTSRQHSLGSHPHSYAYEVTSMFFRPSFSRLVQWTSGNCFSGIGPSSHPGSLVTGVICSSSTSIIRIKCSFIATQEPDTYSHSLKSHYKMQICHYHTLGRRVSIIGKLILSETLLHLRVIVYYLLIVFYDFHANLRTT